MKVTMHILIIVTLYLSQSSAFSRDRLRRDQVPNGHDEEVAKSIESSHRDLINYLDSSVKEGQQPVVNDRVYMDTNAQLKRRHFLLKSLRTLGDSRGNTGIGIDGTPSTSDTSVENHPRSLSHSPREGNSNPVGIDFLSGNDVTEESDGDSDHLTTLTDPSREKSIDKYQSLGSDNRGLRVKRSEHRALYSLLRDDFIKRHSLKTGVKSKKLLDALKTIQYYLKKEEKEKEEERRRQAVLMARLRQQEEEEELRDTEEIEPNSLLRPRFGGNYQPESNHGSISLFRPRVGGARNHNLDAETDDEPEEVEELPPPRMSYLTQENPDEYREGSHHHQSHKQHQSKLHMSQGHHHGREGGKTSQNSLGEGLDEFQKPDFNPTGW